MPRRKIFSEEIKNFKYIYGVESPSGSTPNLGSKIASTLGHP
jgi:hypothetical protein